VRFKSLNTSFLKRQGLSGDEVIVRLGGSELFLEGEQGGSLTIAAEDVDRLRQFKMEAVHATSGDVPGEGTPCLYETKIWWGGGAKPATLTPHDRYDDYRNVILAFAEQVAAVQGPDRLYLGAGPLTAILNLLLVGTPLLLLCAYSVWIALDEGGWWWGAALAVLLFFGWYGTPNIISRWPRRMPDFSRFEQELR